MVLITAEYQMKEWQILYYYYKYNLNIRTCFSVTHERCYGDLTWLYNSQHDTLMNN